MSDRPKRDPYTFSVAEEYAEQIEQRQERQQIERVNQARLRAAGLPPVVYRPTPTPAPTPAPREAGLSDLLWDCGEVVRLVLKEIVVTAQKIETHGKIYSHIINEMQAPNHPEWNFFTCRYEMVNDKGEKVETTGGSSP